MNYFSLFSGIGGFELGIGEKATCVGYSEINPYALSIYQSHFPKHKNYGDITTINTEKLPSFDLLVGGFPCQAFSIAGKRKGLADSRGNLFFEIIRVIAHTKPTYLLLENVKGLLNHDQGKTFTIILQSLAELGYALEWQVLNSKNFGVPQNRERVYIIGYLGRIPGKQVFPLKKADYQYSIPTQQIASPTIRIREATKKGYAVAYIGDSINTSFPTSTMKRGRIGMQIAHTIMTKKCYATLTKNKKLRYITPLECERLQGFPDCWTKVGVDTQGVTVSISDTQRYKCLGNAVTVPVIRAIITQLLLNKN
ncbi:MAG: DNA (cytosine-5-)-methyltransferase [Chitinophagales bacterium]|nr:DNA (cytosine-5-)-methyltransferase [Chitinophagales bacterium]